MSNLHADDCGFAMYGPPAFGKGAPEHNLEPTDPCPVCGDLGTDPVPGVPSKCQDPAAAIRAAAAKEHQDE